MQLTWQRDQINLILPIAVICCCLLIDVTSAQEAQQPWYENLPAVAMDYKVGSGFGVPLEDRISPGICLVFQVHIDAGKEDCYHQYVKAGATFYVSFSVSGGSKGPRFPNQLYASVLISLPVRASLRLMNQKYLNVAVKVF